MTNPNFDIWRPEYPWLDKECSKCKLYWPIYVTGVPEFKNFTPFQSTTSHFWVTGHSETSALKDSKMIKPYKVKATPYFLLLISTSPKFHPVSLYDEALLSYRPFWEKCTEWPQNNLEHYKLKCTPYVLLVSMIPKFHTVLLYGHPFWDIGHFETRAPNDPKLTLNPIRSNYPIYV